MECDITIIVKGDCTDDYSQECDDGNGPWFTSIYLICPKKCCDSLGICLFYRCKIVMVNYRVDSI